MRSAQKVHLSMVAGGIASYITASYSFSSEPK